MQAEQASAILAALRIKPTGQHVEWADLADVYGILLTRIPDTLAPALLEYVHYGHGKWRPTPDEILTWYKRVTGQMAEVNASDVQAEILQAVLKYGTCGVQDAENPRVWNPGMPPLSEEASAVVARLGGWEAVCAMNDTAFRIEVSKTAGSVIEHARLEAERLKVAALIPGVALRLIPGGEAQ